MSANPLWDIVQSWYDAQPIPPTMAKLAHTLGVAQSTFDTWRNPTEMPRRRNLWAIHQLTGVPYKTVVDAAVEAVGLYDPRRAEQAAKDHQERKARKVKLAVLDDPASIRPTRGRSSTRR